MRNLFVRASAIALAAVLTACGTASEPVGSSGSTTGVVTAPVPTTTSTIQVPNNPEGTWQRAGDLCRLIPAAKAGEALGHKGTLIASYSADNLPAIAGKDTCFYTDGAYVAALVVKGEIDTLTWSATLRGAEKIGKVRKLPVVGMDDAFVTAANEAAVRKGNLMGATMNISPGQFSPEGLVRLTALAVNVVAP